MSTSETHSEKATSDDEDFKTNIPYFDGANTATAGSYTHSNSYESLGRNMESGSGGGCGDDDDDDDDANSYNCSNWDNDDGFLDEHGIRVGESSTNYSSASVEYRQVHDNANIFEATSPTESTSRRGTPPASVAYHDDATQEIKYSPPNDLILRPPSNSTVQYNFNYPQSASSRQQMQPPPTQTYGPHPQPHLHPHSHPPPPQTAAQYGEYAQQHAPGFHHPNMWYPNAPYGTGPYYRQYGGPHRYSHYNAGGGYHHSHDPMMDMLQLSNSGREARNRAEKNRRDKLNGSIQELSTMVPHVAESPRRVDKTAVLRFAAHGLRLQYVFSETLNQQRPQVTEQLMKLLDSFFITITCHGQIVLISSSIEQHLGHCQADLYGQNILHITHPEDHNMLRQQLIPTDLENLFDIQPDDDSGEPRCRTQAEEEYIDKKLLEDKRSFTVRLARAGPRSEPTTYEVVKLDGNFRRADSAPRGVKTSTFPSSLQLIRRSRGRDDAIPLHSISGNDIVLIAIARIIRPPKIINCVMEANTLEYKTRHLIDGRIIDCDQRIGLVAGYMTDEVRNLSPFTFMHQDDVRWVIVALRQMYDCNSSYGESTYRLFTRNGNFIYLQSKGYLEIDKDNNNVHSFVCVNTLLNEEEGQRRVQEMKDKFSIIINKKIPQSSVDVPASENPQQLEKAVLCLIQNLHKLPDYDEDVDTSPPSSYTDEIATYGGIYPSGSGPSSSAATLTLPTSASSSSTTAMRMRSNMSMSSSISMRPTKTPPLALVPPEASSVKISITKSVNVVNVNAAKHLRCNQRERSPIAIEEADDDSEDEDEETRYNLDLNATNVNEFGCSICQGTNVDCEYCRNISNRLSSSATASNTTTIGIKRSSSCSKESQDIKLSKRRLKSTEIEHALTNSLSQLDRKLGQQFNAAIELRDKINKYEVPNSNQRIDEILEEHQKQTEIYGYIKSEYKVQMQKKNVIDINTTKTIQTTSTTAANDPQTDKDDDEKLS